MNSIDELLDEIIHIVNEIRDSLKDETGLLITDDGTIFLLNDNTPLELE